MPSKRQKAEVNARAAQCLGLAGPRSLGRPVPRHQRPSRRPRILLFWKGRVSARTTLTTLLGAGPRTGIPLRNSQVKILTRLKVLWAKGQSAHLLM